MGDRTSTSAYTGESYARRHRDMQGSEQARRQQQQHQQEEENHRQPLSEQNRLQSDRRDACNINDADIRSTWKVTYMVLSMRRGWQKNKHPHTVSLSLEVGKCFLSVAGADTHCLQERLNLTNMCGIKVTIVAAGEEQYVVRVSLLGEPIRKFALVFDSGQSATELCRALLGQGVKVHGMEDMPDAVFLQGGDHRSAQALEANLPSLSRPEVQAYIVRLLFQDSFHRFVADLSGMFSHVQGHLPSSSPLPGRPSRSNAAASSVWETHSSTSEHPLSREYAGSAKSVADGTSADRSVSFCCDHGESHAQIGSAVTDVAPDHREGAGSHEAMRSIRTAHSEARAQSAPRKAGKNQERKGEGRAVGKRRGRAETGRGTGVKRRGAGAGRGTGTRGGRRVGGVDPGTVNASDNVGTDSSESPVSRKKLKHSRKGGSDAPPQKTEDRPLPSPLVQGKHSTRPRAGKKHVPKGDAGSRASKDNSSASVVRASGRSSALAPAGERSTRTVATVATSAARRVSSKGSSCTPKTTSARTANPRAAVARQDASRSGKSKQWKVGMPPPVAPPTFSGRAAGLSSALISMWSEANKHRSAWAFRTGVDLTEMPNYLEVVTHPIDLKSIRDRLEGAVVHYTTKAMLYDDLVLMCRNAILFHDQNTDAHSAAEDLLHFIQTNYGESS